ncbi:DNA damage-binding protein 1a, partial [Coemansia sp. RSA 2598]
AGLEPGVRGLLQSGQPEEFGRLSILDAQTMDVLASLLLEPFESPLSLCAATLESPTGTLRDAFVLGTSVVLPGEDDARKGRVLLLQWDESGRRLCIVGSFATVGSVYAVAGFRGMVLAAVANRLLLLGWQTRRQPPSDSVGELPDRVFVAPDADHELVAFCSQQTQIASLSLSVAGDCIVVGDILASASLYRYERQQVKQPRPAHATSAAVDFSLQGGSAGADELVVRHRLVPLARDASGVWTTAVSAVPPPLAQNHALLLPAPVEEETGSGAGSGGRQSMPSYSQTFLAPSCERFVVADAYHNIIRLACTQAEQQSADGANIQEHRLLVEGRWHLGDQINVIKTGSLVMDIPDPEFPDYFRPHLVFGTLNGAVGVIASVENGKLGRILDRLQVNMAHLLPTPGLWSYDRWRAYTSDKRDCESFGYLDGDLIESFLDLSAEMQKLVFSGGGLLLSADKKSQAERERKLEYWSSFSRVEGEADCRCLGQFAVSDIALREGVSLDFVKRLVESLTRLH